jgi:hypothetical protein
MAPKPKEKNLEDLRKIAIDDIKTVSRHHASFWDSMDIDVDAANKEVVGREIQVIWDKISELANENAYPVWMTALTNVLIAIIPVSSIVTHFGTRLLFSKKLLVLPRKTPSGQWVVKPKTEVSFSYSKHELIAKVAKDKEIMERWLKLGQVYAPEVEDALRATITTAANALAQPLFEHKVMVDWLTKRKKPAQADSTGLPSTEVFKSLKRWINVTKQIDLNVLEELMDVAKQSTKKEELEETMRFILEESGISSLPSKLSEENPYLPTYEQKGPPEFFQKFVEACLWCTTYDFTPKLEDSEEFRVNPEIGGSSYTPRLAVLPFPKKFWDTLVARHYDPFMGFKTYKEIGNHPYIAPSNVYKPSDEIRIYFPHGDFDPATRLSIHWSGILAPALLDANQDIARILESLLPH